MMWTCQAIKTTKILFTPIGSLITEHPINNYERPENGQAFT